jgi:uncharacterized membrane protein YccC
MLQDAMRPKNQLSNKAILYFKMHALVMALKVGFAAFISLCLIARFDIDNGYAMLLPMIVVPIAYHLSMEKNFIERALGAFLGSALSIFLLAFISNWMIYTTIIMAFLIFAFAFGSAKNIKYTMVWVLITVGLMYSSAHSSIPDAENMIIPWVRNLWLGSAIYLLVDYSLLPTYPFRQLEKLMTSLEEYKIKQEQKQNEGNAVALDSTQILEFKNRLSEANILLTVSRYRVSSKKISVLQNQMKNLSDWIVLQAQHIDMPPEPALPPKKTARAMTLLDLSESGKTCVTFLVTILLGLYLGLPGGFQIVVVAAVASMQPTLGGLNKKIFDRFCGAVIGSFIALLFILILGKIPSLWCLILLSLSGMMTSTYLGVSRQKYFYVALQAGVVVLLILTMDTHQIVPTTDVMWERIIAVFEGYFISTLVMILLSLRSPHYLKKSVHSKATSPSQKAGAQNTNAS